MIINLSELESAKRVSRISHLLKGSKGQKQNSNPGLSDLKVGGFQPGHHAVPPYSRSFLSTGKQRRADVDDWSHSDRDFHKEMSRCSVSVNDPSFPERNGHKPPEVLLFQDLDVFCTVSQEHTSAADHPS